MNPDEQASDLPVNNRNLLFRQNRVYFYEKPVGNSIRKTQLQMYRSDIMIGRDGLTSNKLRNLKDLIFDK
jgi:hypothetical protein